MNTLNKNTRLIIIGIGDIFLGDDGIGLFLVDRLEKIFKNKKEFAFIKLGKNLFKITDYIFPEIPLLLLDAVRMNKNPGDYKLFKLNSFKIYEKNDISLHTMNLLNIIKLLQILDFKLPEIYIFGVEPALISPGQSLSPTVKNNIGKYINCLSNFIEKFKK